MIGGIAIGAFVGAIALIGGVVGTVFYLGHREWTRLPKSGARVKGNGPPLDEQDDAFMAFTDAWLLLHPDDDEDDVVRWRRRLLVEWIDGDWFIHKHGAVEIKVREIVTSKRTMKCANRGGMKIGFLAFFHGLVHSRLWDWVGDPDHNHDKPGGPWKEEHDRMVKQLKLQHR